MRVREPRPDGCAELAWMHLDLQEVPGPGACHAAGYNAVWIVVFIGHGTTRYSRVHNFMYIKNSHRRARVSSARRVRCPCRWGHAAPLPPEPCGRRPARRSITEPIDIITSHHRIFLYNHPTRTSRHTKDPCPQTRLLRSSRYRLAFSLAPTAATA